MLPLLAAVTILTPPQSPPQAAAVEVTVEHQDNGQARPGFHFAKVPTPARRDAAVDAKFTLVDGRLDRGSPGLDALHDGRLPTDADQPGANCFFSRDGGRFAIDLGSAQPIARIGTYSWHPGPRGPQVYTLYAADGAAAGFAAAPKRGSDPEQCGWRLLAKVDTRPADGDVAGGQYGVLVAAAGGLGSFRHLLFDVAPTAAEDRSSNTFYSEIDVRVVGAAAPQPIVARTADQRFEIRIDATAAPELQDWCDDELMPVLLDWYPQIVALLPSEGYEPPTTVDIRFDNPGRGVAATGRGGVTCAASWFTKNLHGEAIGAVVHELVHVAQRYGGRRGTRGQRPGWLVEGIADYIRWYLYEPQSHGADVVRNPDKARYDGSYRISANFLAWASRTHDQQLVVKLNAALRDGSYSDELWSKLCGKPLDELDRDWHRSLVAPPGVAELTEAERLAGWQLLYNGIDFRGWHSYHRDTVLPGWQIKDGAITCADPRNAGDLCTDARYGEFELSIDYKIAPGGNSGIMFHVDDSGAATWATGPECQLLDNDKGADPQKAGWLYGLYRTDTDATKPAGEWNTLRLLISKERCEHVMNGVKYFDYVLHSDDFEQRLGKSKFARMPGFARFESGYISLQGDHGLISFRNVKIRPITAK